MTTHTGENDIKVHLQSVNGREGWFWMTGHALGGSWDERDDDPLLRADLEHFDGGTDRPSDFTLSADEWKRIVAKDGCDDLLRWTKMGLSLGGAVVAALNNIDADELLRGERSALEASLERNVALCNAAVKVCSALSREPETTRERCYASELQAVLDSQK